jgi:hypothetical protein
MLGVTVAFGLVTGFIGVFLTPAPRGTELLLVIMYKTSAQTALKTLFLC